MTSQNLKTKALITKFLGICVIAATVSACSSNPSARSNQVYHAPKQSFDLNLSSPAFAGESKLKHRCSINAQTTEIIDDLGSYYRIDVLDSNKIEGIELGPDKSQSADQIAEFYRNLYDSPFEMAPTYALDVKNDQQLYFPLPLDRPGPVAKDGRVMGIMAFKRGDYLYTLQHLQNGYSEKLMLTRLKALYNAMQIPGHFPAKVDPSSENQPMIGLIEIDPQNATDAEIKEWSKTSRCKGA